MTGAERMVRTATADFSLEDSRRLEMTRLENSFELRSFRITIKIIEPYSHMISLIYKVFSLSWTQSNHALLLPCQ